MTLIGEKGINLSGGQKQRVSLARSLYADADVILLDDPLSAVDAHVCSKLITGYLSSELRKKTRILVTHNLDCLPFTDYIYMIDDGSIIQEGTWADLTGQTETPFHTLIQEFSSQSKHSCQNKDRQEIQNLALSNGLKSSLLASSGSMDEPLVENEYEDAEERNIQANSSVHFDYFSALENNTWLAALAFFFAIREVAQAAADIWVGVWASDSESANSSTNYVTIYAVLVIIHSILFLISNSCFRMMTVRVGSAFHWRMLHSVIRSPMSFFESTPSGRIINRFSGDQSKIVILFPYFLF